jgi:hypothetical protein
VVKALCYKPEGRGFELFSIYLILQDELDPGVHSNRNEYQEQKNHVSGE